MEKKTRQDSSHKKIQKTHWVLIGLLCALGASVINYWGIQDVYVELVVVLMGLSMSVLTKTISSQYITVKPYNIFHVLAIGSILKMLLIIFERYYARVATDLGSVGPQLLLQCCLLEVTGVFIGYIVRRYEVKRRVLDLGVPFIYLVVMIIGNKVPTSQVSVWLCIAFIIEVMMVVDMLSGEEGEGYDSGKEHIPYLEGLIYIMIFQQFIRICLFSKWTQYPLFFSSLHVVQAVYLLYSVYNICFCLPWQKRLYALSEVEEILQLQTIKSDNIVGLSHELKTPVNVIKSALDLLILDIDPSLKKEVRNMKKECNGMMSIIQDMIDIQKVKTGHIQMQPQKYNLVELFENVLDGFSDSMQICHFVFNPQEEELEEQVDGLLMQQCFMLLMGLIFQYDEQQKVYVEMKKLENIKGTKIILESSNINRLIPLEEVIKQMNQKSQLGNHMPYLLTWNLIITLLELNQATYQVTHEKLEIIFSSFPEGKRAWVDERNKAVLSDQIKCRYLGA